MLRTVEKYEILEELGHGGMATVYRARDTKLDRYVALKILHPHLRSAPEARQRFRREAQSVARLKHPRVLEIYDYSGEDSDESYIAAELLNGPTLRKWADTQTALPAEIAACIAIEVARALGAAHEKGIVHRDVKPENVILHTTELAGTELKLTDFGIADMIDSQSMTATGQILGSPAHMAPEQVEGGATDARTDVFALGTVLYFLACGRLPFTGKNPHQILKRIVDADYTDPLRVEPTIGARLRDVIQKAMSRAPSARYQTARELEDDLRAFVLEAGIDDPARAFARFCQAPDEVRAELKSKVIEQNLRRAVEAREAGRTEEARDRLTRVLSLEPGHPQALELVARTRSRTAGATPWLIVVALVAIAGAGAVLAAGASTPVGDAADAGTLGVAGALDGGRAADLGQTDADAATARVDAASGDVGERDAGERDVGVDSGGEVRRPPDRPPVTVESSPRLVVFDPDPRNVLIGVDEAPPRPYGAQFDSISLAPGTHRFSIVSNVECCADESFVVDVPAGASPYTVRRVLRSRPAILIVRTNAPGDVVVGDGLARGRARASIDVPVAARERVERRTFTVTAPGFADYTGEVQLAAGTVTSINVTLEPVAASP